MLTGGNCGFSGTSRSTSLSPTNTAIGATDMENGGRRSILGPVIGGALSDPLENHPEWFGEGSRPAFFVKFPFALPNLVCGLFFLFGIPVGILFLDVSGQPSDRFIPSLPGHPPPDIHCSGNARDAQGPAGRGPGTGQEALALG